MADFNTLARQFVDSDSSTEHNRLATQSAMLLTSTPNATTAVRQWIVSVQGWVDFRNDDDDQVARSKAYLFLADTIGHLGADFFNESIVDHLVNYFKAIFQADVRGGIRAAVTALSNLMDQTAFKTSHGDAILSALNNMGDNFKLQDIETRACTYRLILKIISRPDIANELEYQHGALASFMTNLMTLAGSERDPTCLHVWFEILRVFLANYQPSEDLAKNVFEQFSGYFPISLKTNPHPSGLTTDDMKEALRKCFSAHYRIAGLTIPFLLKRLNDGDGIRVNIKLDMLNTLNACIKEYSHVAQGVAPFVDDIWTNLKYEVRNGDVDETIQATLEVIRTMANHLAGKDLLQFALAVQGDCIEDLSNPTYTVQVGKLLMSVLSANPEAFAIMASPVMNALKDNLRHTKSPNHTASLVKLLNSLLELRIALFTEAQSQESTSVAFKATDDAFRALLSSTYADLFSQGTDPAADKESSAIGVEAVNGLRLLLEQKSCANHGELNRPLLDSVAIVDTTTKLLQAWIVFRTPAQRVTETAGAMASAICEALRSCVFVDIFVFDHILMKCAAATGNISMPNVDIEFVGRLLQDLAYIGCSRMVNPVGSAIVYAKYHEFLLNAFKSAYVNTAAPFWTEIIVHGFMAALHHFEATCVAHIGQPFKSNGLDDEPDERFDWNEWVPYVRVRFDMLPTIQDESAVSFKEDTGVENDSDAESGHLLNHEDPIKQLMVDFHLINMYSVRQLYRSVTFASRGDLPTSAVAIKLHQRFNQDAHPSGHANAQQMDEDVFLMRLSAYAQSVISKMTMRQQLDMFLADEVITMFRGNEFFNCERRKYERHDHYAKGRQVREAIITAPSGTLDQLVKGDRNLRTPPDFPMGDLNNGRTFILGCGLMLSLYSHESAGRQGGFDGAFAPWTTAMVAERTIIAGLIAKDDTTTYDRTESFMLAMLTSLGNKFRIEEMPAVSKILRLFSKSLAGIEPWLNKDEQYSLLKEFLGEKTAKTACEDPDYKNLEWRRGLARRMFCLLAGMLRRYKSADLNDNMKAALGHLKLIPAAPQTGYHLARYMEILFTKQDALEEDCHPRIFPLWVQRAYYEIVANMIPKMMPVQVPADASPASYAETKIQAAGYSIAVLHMISHIDYAIWEDKVPQVLPMLLCMINDFNFGHDTARAFYVLSIIAANSSPAIHSHADTIIKHCRKFLSGVPELADLNEPAPWKPEDLNEADAVTPNQFNERTVVIRLLGQLATANQGLLIQWGSAVRRELKARLGDKVREVRKAAQDALSVWGGA